MRVLVASHTYVVGANQAKLRALADTGRVEVGLLVPRRWRDRNLGLEFKLEDATDGAVQLFPAPIALAGRVGGYVFSPPHAVAALRRFHPDVLHVEAEVFSLVALECVGLARACRIPVTMFCRENVYRDLGPRKAIARFVTARLAHLFPGSVRAAELAARWGYKGPVTVVPQLGIERPPDLRARPAPRDPPRVGFVGRLAPWKGVDLFLRALAELLRAGVAARGVVVGRGPEEANLRRLAAELGVEDVIGWVGWVPHDRVPKVLAEIDVLVLPSRSTPTWREQFGHVLIEAMAEGIPVVGSTCGAIPEVIGRADLVFPEEDWRALAALLGRLVRDRAFYADAAAHSVERVRRFTNQAIAEAMLPIWERLATARDPSPAAKER